MVLEMSRKRNTIVASSAISPGACREGGFSLLELMVVIAIVAILALGLSTMSRNPIIDVKSAVFNLRSDLGYARSEAVRRNTPVLVQFTVGAMDGYRICDDIDADNICPVGPNPPANDNGWIKTVTLNARQVQYYDNGIATPITFPAGPNVEVCDGITCDAAADAFWPDPAGPDQDGVVIHPDNNFLHMLADGSCDSNGEIYLYSPDQGDGGATLRTPPLALVVSQSGVVLVRRWDRGTGTWVAN